MQCNIDSRGKRARLISGMLTLTAGLIVLVLAAAAILPPHWWVWLIAGLAVVAGGFQIFEARAGWCVMRAMGFRTPM